MKAALAQYIRGAQQRAAACGEVTVFLTITVPSPFRPGKEGNDATARDGHLVLSRAWARTRALLARRGISIHGLRLAHPWRDGTPTWRVLAFVQDRPSVDLMCHAITHHAHAAAGGVGRIGVGVMWETLDSRGVARLLVLSRFMRMRDGAKQSAWASTWGIRPYVRFGVAKGTT